MFADESDSALGGGPVILASLFRLAGIEPLSSNALPEIAIRDVVDDSRKVRPGSCFVSVRHDEAGQRFMSDAVYRGATVVVSERFSSEIMGIPVVVVHDARRAVSSLAAAFHGLCGMDPPPLRIIGITGTNGKTTVAWLLRAILRAAGRKTALLGTVEYDLVTERLPASLTTPGPVDLCRSLATSLRRGAEYAVLEVSSHALDQRRTDGLPFCSGVFTNLTGDHLDYHRSMEDYAAAKRRLFELLPGDAIAVINADDPWCHRIGSGATGRVFEYGLDAKRADFTARILSADSTGSRLRLIGPGVDFPIGLSLLGRHNVSNALAAAATAIGLGFDPEAVTLGLESVSGVPGRLQRVELEESPFTVLVDYAHTDDALCNVLQAVRSFTTGRVRCVFGCGGNRDRSKRPRMGRIVSALADHAYITSDNPRTEDPAAIIDEIVAGFDRSQSCELEVHVERREAIAAAIEQAEPRDTILIAGKGHETYQLVGDRVLPFDDVEVAKACFMNRAVEEVSI